MDSYVKIAGPRKIPTSALSYSNSDFDLVIFLAVVVPSDTRDVQFPHSNPSERSPSTYTQYF